MMTSRQKAPPRRKTNQLDFEAFETNYSGRKPLPRKLNVRVGSPPSSTKTRKKKSSAAAAKSSSSDPWANIDKQLDSLSSVNTQNEIFKGLVRARQTAKLSLVGIGLTTLPDSIFDIRSDIIDNYDISMDTNADASNKYERAWECYGEESLRLVDLSDNDLSCPVTNTNAGNSNKATNNSSTSTPTKSPWKSKKSREGNGDEEPHENPNLSLCSQPGQEGILDSRIGCYTTLLTLRIKRCQLQSLPWDIIQSKLTQLTTLDASGNLMTFLPLDQLPPSIQCVEFSENKLQRLTHDHGATVTLPLLTKLNLEKNDLSNIAFDQIHTPKLCHLLLPNNNISTIPQGFLDSCRDSLLTLDITKNQLQGSIDLSHHSKLQVVELNYNRLSTIPSIHANLSRLAVNGNKISSLVGMFPLIVDADGNPISTKLETADHPTWFRSNLRELHLQRNGLQKILDGHVFTVMTQLALLDLTQNNLENLPPVLGHLPELHKILVEANPLRFVRYAMKYKDDGYVDVEQLKATLKKKELPPPGPEFNNMNETEEERELQKKKTDAKSLVAKTMGGTHSLDMKGGEVVYTGTLDAPEVIDALNVERTIVNNDDNSRHKVKVGESVKVLNLWNNRELETIGKEWIEALPKCVEWNLKKNGLTSLPKGLEMMEMKRLICLRNNLTSRAIQNSALCLGSNTNLAKNLVELDLSSNKLEWVPSSIFYLTSLQNLNLSFNQIQSLEWDEDDNGVCRGWRHGLISLQHLDLSNNFISDLGYLPLALSGCKQLRTLLLNNNKLSEIPNSLGLLDQLTTIDLLGNTQRAIRVGVLTQSCNMILSYLKSKMTPSEVAEIRQQHEEIEYALAHGSFDEDEDGDEYEENYDDQTTQTTQGEDVKALVDQLSKKKENVAPEQFPVKVDNELISPQQKQHQPTFQKREMDEPSDSTTRSKQNQRLTTSTAAKATDNQTTASTNPVQEKDIQETALVDTLRKNIELFSLQLEDLSISQAKRYALKKSLAMEKSKLIREERRLKSLRS